ncbi:MAG TPA: hypothetical protein VHV55_23960 [Pirellulales bacterium]|jgi:hypothetical protein|nr:hypothetical protein [Pirellulales bacterium]
MPLPPSASNRLRAWFRLLAAAAIVAAIWLGILPYIGSRPPIRAYIERNDSRGIDPSAKFYTELPGMPRFAAQIDDARRRDAAAFGMGKR